MHKLRDRHSSFCLLESDVERLLDRPLSCDDRRGDCWWLVLERGDRCAVLLLLGDRGFCCEDCPGEFFRSCEPCRRCSARFAL